MLVPRCPQVVSDNSKIMLGLTPFLLLQVAIKERDWFDLELSLNLRLWAWRKTEEELVRELIDSSGVWERGDSRSSSNSRGGPLT